MDYLKLGENKEEYILKKSNYCINSMCQYDIISLQILYLGMCSLQNGEYTNVNGGHEISFKVKELSTLLGNNSNRIYERLKDAALVMTQNFGGYNNPEKQAFEFFPLFKSVSYKDGIFSMVFNDSLDFMLLNIKDKYCKIGFNTAMSFKSPYAYKLYEVLREKCYYPANYQGKKDGIFEYEFNISELKFAIGANNINDIKVTKYLNKQKTPDFEEAEKVLTNPVYSDWHSFNNCLARIVNEINGIESSDILVNYKKNGKSNFVKFTIILKNYSPVENNEDETKKTAVITQMAELVSKYKLSTGELEEIAKCAKYDIETIKKAVNVLNQSRNVLYPVKFLISAIKNNYTENTVNTDIVNETRNKQLNPYSFSNFNQRVYDYEELERMALTSPAKE